MTSSPSSVAARCSASTSRRSSTRRCSSSSPISSCRALAAYLALGLKFDTWNPASRARRSWIWSPCSRHSRRCRSGTPACIAAAWRVAGVADLARAGGAAAAVTVAGAVVHPLLSSGSAAGVGLPDLWPGHRGPGDRLTRLVCRPAHESAAGEPSRRSRSGVRRRQARRRGDPGAVRESRHRAEAHRVRGRRSRQDGQFVNGLPVLGRSYELDSLITAHGVKAVVIAAPAVPPDCHAPHRGRERPARDQTVPHARAARTAPDEPAPSRAASRGLRAPACSVGGIASPSVVPVLESEPCAECGGRNVRRSRVKGVYERFRKLHTPARPFRCDDCGWRGWLLPLDHAMAIDEIVEADLRPLDAAFSPHPARAAAGAMHGERTVSPSLLSRPASRTRVTRRRLLVLAWGALAFGAVYDWAFWPLAAACALCGAHALMRPSPVPRLPGVLTSVGLAAIAVATLAQIVPLPVNLLTALSPHAARCSCPISTFPSRRGWWVAMRCRSRLRRR